MFTRIKGASQSVANEVISTSSPRERCNGCHLTERENAHTLRFSIFIFHSTDDMNHERGQQ